MLEAIVAAVLVVQTVALVVAFDRISRLERLLRVPPPPPVTVNERRPLAPGVVPRGTPTYAGRLATRLEARTQRSPRVAIDTAEMALWDADVSGLPAGYMADGSPVAYRPDGTFARAHETYRHRYEPLGANQRRMAGVR